MDYAGFIHELLAWIDDNIDEALTLDTIAFKSGYSKWHLRRIFNEAVGVSLGVYIPR
mgnify:CR=1 FL=1